MRRRGGVNAGPSPFLAAPHDVAAPSEDEVIAFEVRGYGNGHGRGLSQWGAYAMARRGESHERILSHYYRGTVLRPYGQP